MTGFVTFNILLGFVMVLCAVPTASSVPLQTDANTKAILEYLKLDAVSPPEIELVGIEVSKGLHKRSLSDGTMTDGTRMYLIRPSGDSIDLLLKPADSALVTEDTFAYCAYSSPNSPGKVRFEKYNIMDKIGKLLKDDKHSASLVVGTDDHGRTTVNGVIPSGNLVIRSLPQRFVNDNKMMSRSSKSAHHVVYKRNAEPEEYDSNDAIHIFNPQENITQTNFSIPNILYVKLVVVADFSQYESFGGDLDRFCQYIVAFLNGVDLRYRAFQAPQIRLHIPTIIMEMDNDAISYMSNARINNSFFSFNKAFPDMQPYFDWLGGVITIGTYQMGLTLTKLTGVLTEPDNTTGTPSGVGYGSGKCDSATEGNLGFAIVSESSQFNGVNPAVHELAHLLNIDHDPTTGDCPNTNGFVMGTLAENPINSSTFSECSLQELQKRLMDKDLECLYDKPRTDGKILPVLIGDKSVDLDAQCKHQHYEGTCSEYNLTGCLSMQCKDLDGFCYILPQGLLDGTPCTVANDTSKRQCLLNQCVFLGA